MHEREPLQGASKTAPCSVNRFSRRSRFQKVHTATILVNWWADVSLSWFPCRPMYRCGERMPTRLRSSSSRRSSETDQHHTECKIGDMNVSGLGRCRIMVCNRVLLSSELTLPEKLISEASVSSPLCIERTRFFVAFW